MAGHDIHEERYASLFYIPRLDITQPLSFFSRWLFLKNLRNNVATIDVPTLFQ